MKYLHDDGTVTDSSYIQLDKVTGLYTVWDYTSTRVLATVTSIKEALKVIEQHVEED